MFLKFDGSKFRNANLAASRASTAEARSAGREFSQIRIGGAGPSGNQSKEKTTRNAQIGQKADQKVARNAKAKLNRKVARNAKAKLK